MFCKNGFLTNFAKIHKKTPVLEFHFSWSFRSTASNFIKKRLRHRCPLVNFAKYVLYRTPLDDCFDISLILFTVPSRPLPFSKTMSRTFSGWIFYRPNLLFIQILLILTKNLSHQSLISWCAWESTFNNHNRSQLDIGTDFEYYSFKTWGRFWQVDETYINKELQS